MADHANPKLAVADVLERAANLLENCGWTQGVYARDLGDKPTSVYSNDASCFCLRGALVRVGGLTLHEEGNTATEALGFTTARQLVRWNDAEKRSKEQVVTRLRSAAALARSQATS